MIMFRRTHRRLVLELQRIAGDRSHELRDLQRENLQLQVALPLVRQALDRAEQDAQYWRRRAELFIDQVGLRERIITTPTMTEEPPAPISTMDSVFGALGTAEINTKTPEAGAATTAPTVIGVSPEAAQAAVKDLLARVV